MEALTQEYLLSVIDARNVNELRNVFNEYNSVDIADLLKELPINKAIYAFTTVPSSLTADVFAYLDDDYQQSVIESLKDADLKKILAELYTDDIVDVVEEMPTNIVRKILRSVDKTMRADINKLLSYKEDSAGSLMGIEYVELKSSDTCGSALAKIRKLAKEVETVSWGYVVNTKRDLLGYVSLKTILSCDDEELITDIMEQDIICVHVDDDREDVAATFKKYDLSSLAVVSKENKMLGIITADDIIDVIEEEATEDIEKMAKMIPLEEDYFEVSSFSMFKKRIGWLVILLAASTLSAMVLNSAEATIATVGVLTTFMPMITGTAGNAGSQTTALLIRGLSLGTIKTKDFFKALLKEFFVGMMVGVALGVVCYAWLWLEQITGIVVVEENTNFVFLVVAFSVFLVVVVAKLIATTLPIAAKLVKLDPAVMAGPLVTTVADAIAILIYFSIARQFLLPLFM
jgi:magnesium transporter